MRQTWTTLNFDFSQREKDRPMVTMIVEESVSASAKKLRGLFVYKRFQGVGLEARSRLLCAKSPHGSHDRMVSAR